MPALMSEVGLPEVKFETALPNEAVPGGQFDQFFFRCGAQTLGRQFEHRPQQTQNYSGQSAYDPGHDMAGQWIMRFGRWNGEHVNTSGNNVIASR